MEPSLFELLSDFIRVPVYQEKKCSSSYFLGRASYASSGLLDFLLDTVRTFVRNKIITTTKVKITKH